jgi:tetratricopeptide (TPR) repeat protein
MSKARFLGRYLTLAVCLWAVVPARAASAEGEFQRYIAEAVRLYDDLEYEQALEQLERASKVPHGMDEDVALGLYKGIISADLGRWEAAREAFKSALMLKPDARLPLRVSPKVTAAFEAQRAKVQAELARKRTDTPKIAESRPGAEMPGAVPPVESGQVSQQSKSPEQVARPDLVPTRPEEPAAQVTTGTPWTRHVPVTSMVLLGAGVAAGGAGTYFGLSSRSQLDEARGAQFRDELVERHGQAQSSARTANILFGTAGLAVAGAVVTWLLMGDSGTASAQEGAR